MSEKTPHSPTARYLELLLVLQGRLGVRDGSFLQGDQALYGLKDGKCPIAGTVEF